MKRRIIQIVVLLLLGAILNIAVAWGCSFTKTPSWSDTVLRGTYIDRGNGGIWNVNLFERTARSYFFSTRVDRIAPESIWNATTPDEFLPLELLPAWSRIPRVQLTDDDRLHQVWHERTYGLPIRSMYDAFELGGPTTIYHWRIQIPGSYKVLPLAIVWPGFAINTIFYAAILWVLFFIAGKVRRAIRRRRGLCPACAYPIGTSPVCTECGYKLNVRTCNGAAAPCNPCSRN